MLIKLTKNQCTDENLTLSIHNEDCSNMWTRYFSFSVYSIVT